jgi:SAM-dependent methyltransferase
LTSAHFERTSRWMTQNIYDNAVFFDAYGQLPRSLHGLDAAPEWPSLRALLPDLRGLRVLDLGCGYGWFSRWARAQGAADVLAIDVSERMLERARRDTADAGITYLRADLETVALDHARHDVAYSSLALHYIADLEGLLRRIHASLVPGGRFVFSAEHPLMTAPARPGWLNSDGRRVWPVHGYLDEGERRTDWLAKGVIKQHRTIATYINLLMRCGFAIAHLDEWGPTAEQIAARPELADEYERPAFLLVACNR